MNDEQFFLANAYLDGELTADERAIAEADPTVMAEVESLRALRDQLRDVDPPSTSARESGVAAAMAVFESSVPTEPSHHRPADVAPVVPITRRPWFPRALTAAAAVVGVALLATVVTQLPSGDDDDAGDDAAAELPAEEFNAAEEDAATAEDTGAAADVASEDTAAELGESAAVPEASGDMARDEAAEDGGDDGGSTAEAGVADDAGDAAEEMSEESTVGADGDDAGGLFDAAEPCPPGGLFDASDDDLPGTSPGDPITDVDGLCAFGRSVVDAIDRATLPPTPETSCRVPFQDIWDSAFLDWTSGVIEIHIALDDGLRVVTAVDADTCEPLLVVDLRPTDR